MTYQQNRKRIGLLFLLLAATAVASPRTTTVSIRIEDLVKGWSFNERMGMKVQSLMAGGVNIGRLFQPISKPEPSPAEYYLARIYSIRLALNSSKDVEALRSILIKEKTDRITVVIRDERDTIWRKVVSDSRFNRVIELVVGSPCEELTRVIFDRVNTLMREQASFQGQTDKHIDLDALFGMLMRDNILPYIKRLDPVKQTDSCFKTFRLLKWLRGEDVPGFEFGEYGINEGLRSLLDPVIAALLDVRSTWSRSSIVVQTVGFTDPVPVTNAVPLLFERTGLPDLAGISRPLAVRYAGCTGDMLSSGNPVFLDLDSEGSASTATAIRNNCELSASRAYVTAIYIRRALGPKDVRYKYAAAGVHRASAGKKADPKRRKVGIEFIIKSAKRDR